MTKQSEREGCGERTHCNSNDSASAGYTAGVLTPHTASAWEDFKLHFLLSQHPNICILNVGVSLRAHPSVVLCVSVTVCIECVCVRTGASDGDELH